eukprot:15348206-Alexandrium_andersonii.AAC.1
MRVKEEPCDDGVKQEPQSGDDRAEVIKGRLRQRREACRGGPKSGHEHALCLSRAFVARILK